MTTETAAVISLCGLYRYKLTRPTEVQAAAAKRVVWVMLNPSTADASTNDPTINAVLDFSTRWACGHVDVVNLYALRSTDPRNLWRAADPVGPVNDAWISATCAHADLVVCAWGSNAKPERAAAVRPMLPLGKTFALAVNKNGAPKHPLYIRRDTPLKAYSL